MSPTPRRRRRPAPDPFPERGLAELGLAAGDPVRFRRTDTERWKQATVARRERDGSVGLHDTKGASRAIPIDCIEVRDTGPRGGVIWEPLAVRAARTEQLPLVKPRAPERATSPPPTDGPLPAPPTAVPPPDTTDATDHGPDDDGQLTLL